MKKVLARRFPKIDLVKTRTPLSTGFRFWYARVASCDDRRERPGERSEVSKTNPIITPNIKKSSKVKKGNEGYE
jgi:hypothetical protein